MKYLDFSLANSSTWVLPLSLKEIEKFWASLWDTLATSNIGKWKQRGLEQLSQVHH